MELDFSRSIMYHYDRFPPSSLDYGQFINQLIAASDALARFDQMLKKMHNNEIFLAPLRNQEAVISSRIEGTISTMDEILEFEADSDDTNLGQANPRSDVLETILYQRTLKAAQQAILDGYPFSSPIIRMMHQRLLQWGRGATKSPGEFKIEQNYLADPKQRKIQFVPISPEKLSEGLDKLFDFLERSKQPALLKTALMHLEFEALHPFQDGNGRIGRMLITLYLWKEKIISAPHFYISGYLEENKDQYIDTMRKVSEQNCWEEWCKFFLTAVEKQAIRNLEVTESIQKLYERMKVTFSEILASKWSMVALDFIFTNPIFRNSKFTGSAGIPFPSAFKFTNKLLENGIIVERQAASGRRAALYAFEDLMKLVRV